jgi:hypothetical protein
MPHVYVKMQAMTEQLPFPFCRQTTPTLPKRASYAQRLTALLKQDLSFHEQRMHEEYVIGFIKPE